MSWIRTFLVELYTWARIAVGLVFFLSGRGKLFVPERREQMRQTLVEDHVPFPEINALFVSAVEFVCGQQRPVLDCDKSSDAALSNQLALR
jgi:hypothetical protein